jgi:hypothetical protein
MLQARRSRVPFPIKSLNFSVDYAPGVDSASNRDEYQESSWGVKGGRPARKADNLTAICEPKV